MLTGGDDDPFAVTSPDERCVATPAAGSRLIATGSSHALPEPITADVALAWLLHQKAVTAPIIGPRTEEQLDGSLRALAITLSADARRRLDAIFPGPGGSAPEAYAW